jgi:hypothetical protein
MGSRILALPLIVIAFAGFGGQQPAPRVPVLAELFTSEGCNSCRPADRLLEHLLEEQPIAGVYVVALSEHVTYWDQQGWKDPFDSQQFTARQQQYGLRFNLDSIYTPQLVIDGGHELIGSDQRSIERTLRDAAKVPKPPMQVQVTSGDGVLDVAASGPGAAEKDGELWFALTEDHLVVDVKRGENANKALRHSGVVRILQSAGGTDVSSKKLSFKLSPDWHRENLRVVAFVQSRKDRRILSVAWCQLGSG